MKRVTIALTFSADLDQVPGWGHQAEDWIKLVTYELQRNPHYNTRVEIQAVEVKPVNRMVQP
jgi:hypothetical protein